MGHLSYGIPVLKLLGIEAYSKRSEIANGILFRMHSRDRNRRVQLQMTVAFPNLQSRSSSIFSSSNTNISESNVITRFKKIGPLGQIDVNEVVEIRVPQRKRSRDINSNASKNMNSILWWVGVQVC